MALPKVKHPTTIITIPSTKQPLTIRPFLVREEKILLIAQSSDNKEDVTNAVLQVIKNCVVKAPKGYKIETAPLFDIEFIFIRLRAFSVNNIIEINYTDPDDNKVHEFDVDLNKVEVRFDPTHNNKIDLMDGIGMMMKYPNLTAMLGIQKQFTEISETENREDATEALFSIFANSIDKIWEGEKVYVAGTDFTPDEAKQFLEQLSTEKFEKIQQFFQTMPALQHEIKYTNTKGEEKTFMLRGLSDFFV